MSKLFLANMNRLFKSKSFIITASAMFVFGIISIIMVKQDNINLLHQDRADKAFGGYIMPVCILLAFVCSTFYGEEYDGTIRNKLNVGNTRFQVYTSQYISCFVAGVAMCFSFLIPTVLLGEMMLGGFYTKASYLFSYFISSIALTAACASIYCLMITIAAKKSAGMALTIFIMLIVMWIGRQLQISLFEIPDKTFHPVMENGELTSAYIDNPLYPTGVKRTILKYAYDILPSTQSWQITYFPQNSVPIYHSLKLAAFSVIVAAAAFLVGIKVFEQKDLK